MANYTTGAQRYNNRMDKLFEAGRKHEAAKEAAFQELLKLVSPDGMINFITEKLTKLKTMKQNNTEQRPLPTHLQDKGNGQYELKQKLYETNWALNEVRETKEAQKLIIAVLQADNKKKEDTIKELLEALQMAEKPLADLINDYPYYNDDLAELRKAIAKHNQ